MAVQLQAELGITQQVSGRSEFPYADPGIPGIVADELLGVLIAQG